VVFKSGVDYPVFVKAGVSAIMLYAIVLNRSCQSVFGKVNPFAIKH